MNIEQTFIGKKKRLNKLETEGNFINLIKNIYKKPVTDITLLGKDERLSLGSGPDHYVVLIFSFHTLYQKLQREQLSKAS